MNARTRWILAIVGLLAANVIAMVVLAVSAGSPKMVPGYQGVEKKL